LITSIYNLILYTLKVIFTKYLYHPLPPLSPFSPSPYGGRDSYLLSPYPKEVSLSSSLGDRRGRGRE